MLGSISPFGERTRNQRWALTVGAYVAGSTLSGALLGWAVGLAGTPAVRLGFTSQARLALLLAIVAVGVALELGLLGGARIPTVHRQVNEDWLVRYRGWVYGLGFGAQLGVGVATIVTTSAVYATWAAALLAGSAAGGSLIGATFGLVRAASVLTTARATTAASAYRIDGWLRRWETPSRVAAIAAQAAVVTAVALSLIL